MTTNRDKFVSFLLGILLIALLYFYYEAPCITVNKKDIHSS